MEMDGVGILSRFLLGQAAYVQVLLLLVSGKVRLFASKN